MAGRTAINVGAAAGDGTGDLGRVAMQAINANFAELYALASRAIPSGIAPNGSFANNGAFTLGTALDAVVPGCYLRFPANAIFAGSSAGSFYCTMSSTTQGVAFNNSLPVLSEPIAPASPTAFVCTGPGAYTQDLGMQFTLASYTVPGGALGKYGSLRFSGLMDSNSSATAKTYRLIFGGVTFLQVAPSVNNLHPIFRTISNCGATNFQVSETQTADALTIVAGPIIPAYGAFDTQVDQTFSYTQQLNTAGTDWAMLYRPMLELLLPANPA